MKKDIYWSLLTLCLVNTAYGTHTTNMLDLSLEKARVVTLSIGPAWYRGGETQTLEIIPDFFNTYTANKITRSLASGELFVGLQRPISTRLSGQLGIAGSIYNSAHLQGSIWEMADPNFDNFSYRYNIRQKRVALKGLLLSHAFSRAWLPYLSSSAGIGFNKADSFTIIPTLFSAVAPPAFQNNTITSFSYTFGVGLRKTLNAHWQAGIGYEFADWGKSRFNPASGQTLNTSVQLNHLYTNELQFSLSCFI